MEITYTWNITKVLTKNEGIHSDAIVQTYWEKIGADGDGNTGVFNGATPFSSIDVPEGEFIPLEQLTEATVLNWIQTAIGEGTDYELHINDVILRQIENSISPTVEANLPWIQG